MRQENNSLTTEKLGCDLLSIYLTMVIKKKFPLKPFQDKEAITQSSQHTVVLVCMYPHL